MSVKAKFRVACITDHGNDTKVVKLAVVTNGDDNKSWSKYTPQGQIELTITNPAASSQFEVGKEYFLTFDPA